MLFTNVVHFCFSFRHAVLNLIRLRCALDSLPKSWIQKHANLTFPLYPELVLDVARDKSKSLKPF